MEIRRSGTLALVGLAAAIVLAGCGAARAIGTAALFHNDDGSFTLTFEDFSIGSAAHTNVVLVTNKDVTSDSDIDKAAIVDLGPLKGTSGMQDFSVPHAANAMTLHTVVLWDTELAHSDRRGSPSTDSAGPGHHVTTPSAGRAHKRVDGALVARLGHVVSPLRPIERQAEWTTRLVAWPVRALVTT